VFDAGNGSLTLTARCLSAEPVSGVDEDDCVSPPVLWRRQAAPRRKTNRWADAGESLIKETLLISGCG
jgi:hypothetical protein